MSYINRRKFLQRSSVLAAATVLTVAANAERIEESLLGDL